MNHNLAVFAFCAVLLGLAYHFAFGEFYQHFFAASFAFQTYWYVPFLLIPALLQTGLGWLLGFWRPKKMGWADAGAAAIVIAVVYLNLDASFFSCGSDCF
jgi:hypothetical protein